VIGIIAWLVYLLTLRISAGRHFQTVLSKRSKQNDLWLHENEKILLAG